MFEILFLTGVSLQLAWMLTSHKSKKVKYVTTGGILSVSLLLWLVSLFVGDAFIESLTFIGMTTGGLAVIPLGFFSMKGAKIWRPVEVIALQSIMLFALSTIENTGLWILATQIGLPISVLLLIAARFLTLLRIIPYFWTLVLSLVLGVVYILPIMAIMEPMPFDIFLVGSLFVTMGVSGFFALKFCTMCIASLLNKGPTYKIVLNKWMDTYLPMRFARIEDSLLLILIILSTGSFFLGIQWLPTTVLLLLLSLLLRQKSE